MCIRDRCIISDGDYFEGDNKIDIDEYRVFETNKNFVYLLIKPYTIAEVC